MAAALYLHVGRLVGQRRTTERAQPALESFGTWWLALGVSTAISASQSALGALGRTDLDLFVTLGYLNLLVVVVALHGLMSYLLYLFTGRTNLAVPLAVSYAAAYVVLLHYVVSSDPVGVEVRRWTTTLAYETPLAGPVYGAVLAMLVLPPMLGSGALLTLLPRTRDRTARYRIALVATSIIVWFGTTLVAAGTGTAATSDTWQLASRFLGLGAALATLLAYRPPAVVRRRLGVAPVEAPSAPANPRRQVPP